jgi:hypothetical protein
LFPKFQLTQVVVYIGIDRDSPWFYALQVLSSMTNQIAGMYPTIIIVIVNFKCTFWDEESSISNGVNTLPLSFKQPGPADAFGGIGGIEAHHETMV